MFFTGPTPRYISPIILGHEICAEIAEMGSSVQGYDLGDLVTVAPLVPCMRCSQCSSGRDNLCEMAQVLGCTVHGGFAQHMHVPDQMVLAGGVVKVPSGVDPPSAALTELVGCCLHGLQQTPIRPGDRVLIIGDGPIGLTFLQLVRHMGAGYAATSGRRKRRRELALELGADEALDARSVALRDLYPQGLDTVIVAAANIEVTAEAIDLVRPGGNLLLFSGYRYGTTLPLDVNAVHYRELHLHGSIDCTVRDFRQAAKILPLLHMDRLITSKFSLQETAQAFHATREPNEVKVVIEPWQSAESCAVQKARSSER
jgi:L-iditol 2-dehydrogenase